MVGIISREEFGAMFFHEPLDVANFRGGKAVAGGKRNGTEPELGFKIIACNVDVRRFAVLATVKMETIRTNPHDSRHGAIVLTMWAMSSGQ
jgi:hypothetical protein